uniref:coiled-coil domain-containing protein 8-like isoform X1 n=1 Tax=Oncorhynchus gorbuscha TaxID=8017 RepID=UPI001EAEEC4F|nr:coiled-coil domain-containing protein 8-like isoform X1 [Oncorhynchus gorbuscha]
MAVTFGLSLSVSWFCCLLIGGIKCFPLQGDACTGSQASVVSVPNAKATGYNTLASVTQGPNAEATANHVSAEAAGPHASAEATANHTSAEAAAGPRASAEAARASAEATANHTSAEAAGPRASAEATASHTSAEAAGPRASAEATAKHTSAEATIGASAEATAKHTSAVAAPAPQLKQLPNIPLKKQPALNRPLNKLDREIIIWFAQLLNRLSPVTVPPFEEKGKGN